MALSDSEIAHLEPIFSAAIQDGANVLGQMLNSEFNSGRISIKEVTLKDMPHIFGGSQKIISGIYMQYNLDRKLTDSDLSFSGHVLLTFKIESAYEIAAILTQDLDVPLDKIGGMTDSIFGEIGNVFGTTFLSSLANKSGFVLMPTIPTVINYKANAILDYVNARISAKEPTILLIQTNIKNEKLMIDGKFYVLPDDYKSIIRMFSKTA